MNKTRRTATAWMQMPHALIVAILICLVLVGCVEKEPSWASPSDFPTLRIRLDNETVISAVDTEAEVAVRQMVWDYIHAGDLTGPRAGEYNILRSEMQKEPYLAINSTDFVRLQDGVDSVLVYFILVSLTQHEDLPDGIICDTIYCTRVGSTQSTNNLSAAVREYMSEGEYHADGNPNKSLQPTHREPRSARTSGG